MRLQLDLEQDAMEALIAASVGERRPIHFQAEVQLRRSLGLPDVPPKRDHHKPDQTKKDREHAADVIGAA